ncbi:MaoC family dehydratase [Pseudomonas aeruginosa]|uniref:MaoC family dehydratase n=1 Tax=Pseudomonas aeruginosa TaxID=287 RepID=UPI000E2DB495|nr:MaoC family dehydratase [Pseudomonas aeruginosa]SVK36104.1 dehydratase [Acinetobacter baumannii]MDC3991887.1 MaoC family dehydratase [Pseudomonas aeruginosa]RQE90754.1 acyl dehydratase [Pseudomonas aeruginosa]WCV06889.1 MaoC family dehydratase [Pseudomonas aeruginosa]HBP6729778.1 MaoC family dehydratase [Pseudomonas aeruginosa]
MSEKEWRDRFYEDFSVGDVCKHRNARTVTTNDNMMFTLLTQNPAPLHLNHEYARAAGHERMPFNSTFTMALVTGQSVADLTPNVMTNLGWTDVKLPAPAYEGDTLYSESEVVSLRTSSRHPQAGIMSLKTIGYNQHGTIVIEFIRTVMIYKRGCSPSMSRPEPLRKP